MAKKVEQSKAFIKLVALLPLVRFGLPYREGMEFETNANLAEELVESGYAELKNKTTVKDIADLKVNDAEQVK